jgi:peptidoglycan hydrolase-like protein with peptidoglycan-binding domain
LLQFTLQAAGYSTITVIDGIFGDQTEAALRQFQEDEGLPVTGVADEATWSALSPQEFGTDRNGNGYVDPSEADMSDQPGA